MTEAPAIKAHKSTINKNDDIIAPEIEEVRVVSPKVSYYGCGGFGVNIIKLLEKIGFDELVVQPELHVLDTSTSNLEKVGAAVKSTLICRNGSGKNRACNVKDIVPAINKMQFENQINIVIFSLGGGSGSVIGPLLVNAIRAAGKSAIIITVADAACQTTADNALKTLSTLQNLANQSRTVFPIIMFNNIGNDEHNVNTGVFYKILHVTRLFTADGIQEIDTADLNNFLHPANEVGLYAMDVAYLTEQCEARPYQGESLVDISNSDNICMTSIYVTPDRKSGPVSARIAFKGICDQRIAAVNGFPIDEAVITDIKHKLKAFRSRTVEQQNFDVDDSTTDNSGLIL